MDLNEPMTVAQRLVALMDHFGIAAAHVATQIPGDVTELARTAADRIASLVLCAPTRLDTAPFAGFASRLLVIAGDKGLTAEAAERAAARLPDLRRVTLSGYDPAGWSDVVKDRGDEVAAAVTSFLAGIGAARPLAPPARRPAEAAGEHAGLTWRLSGSGPPLLLLPFFLAPSQWEPAVAKLAEQFTVIRIGGPNIGGVAALEDRARAPTYRAMFNMLVDLLAPEASARILDVGCGSGALDRLLAHRLGTGARIEAIDLNPFFLAEARGLAEKEGVAERIAFKEGSATALPFADASFECIFSVTVLEECDADRAIAEMVRVARPGARIGIVVRAIDVAQWWNLDLPPVLRERAAVPPQSVGQGGVADRSLYLRMRRAGLADLKPFPALITLDRPDGPIWRYREDAVLPLLDAEETTLWQRARASAADDGVLMQSHVLHAAVATKPRP
jgi:SAM-dependent methyltransferase